MVFFLLVSYGTFGLNEQIEMLGLPSGRLVIQSWIYQWASNCCCTSNTNITDKSWRNFISTCLDFIVFSTQIHL